MAGKPKGQPRTVLAKPTDTYGTLLARETKHQYADFARHRVLEGPAEQPSAAVAVAATVPPSVTPAPPAISLLFASEDGASLSNSSDVESEGSLLLDLSSGSKVWQATGSSRRSARLAQSKGHAAAVAGPAQQQQQEQQQHEQHQPQQQEQQQEQQQHVGMDDTPGQAEEQAVCGEVHPLVGEEHNALPEEGLVQQAVAAVVGKRPRD